MLVKLGRPQLALDDALAATEIDPHWEKVREKERSENEPKSERAREQERE